MRLDIEFADGHVGATADGAMSGGATDGGATAGGMRLPVPHSPAAEPAKPKLRRGGNPGQGSLF
jgi:hypothetical protein